jgi:hypothetical protein
MHVGCPEQKAGSKSVCTDASKSFLMYTAPVGEYIATEGGSSADKGAMTRSIRLRIQS